MGDDITIGVTEIVNNIEVTAQPNDQIVDISVIDNADDVTLNITPTVIEINVNRGSSFAKWGTILGTLSDQTDLQNALDLKANLVGGKVPASELPSYVDDVIEVANYAALPATGETGKIYVTIDNNKIFRWTGSTYVEIIDSAAVWGAITGTLSSQTDLQNALNLKANDNAVVKLTGDQTISGVKTFSNPTTFNSSLNIASGAYSILYNPANSAYWQTYVDSSNVFNFGYNGNIVKASISNSGNFTANSFIKSGGTSSQFLKADGSIDSTTYQTALTNPITGTGTTNYLPKFTGASAIGNSLIYDDGTNVGIGTTSPLSKLHIEGDNSSTTDETVLTLRGNGENGKRIDFRNAFGSLARITGTKLAGGASADEGILIFETAINSVLSEKMRITSGGNVGIGTTSPSTLFHIYKASFPILTIQSSSYQSSLGIDTTSGNLVLNNESNAPLSFNTNATERMRITSGGNVGIGTTSPNSNGGASARVVHIHGPASGDWAVNHYTNLNTGANADDGTVVGIIGSGRDMYIFNYEDSNVIIGTNSAERMRITSGGSVLVNTTSLISADAKMEIKGDSSNYCLYLNAPVIYAGIYRFQRFYANGSAVGDINSNGTSTSYSTTSDYRLKQDLKPINGLDLVSQIKVYDYQWKSDETRAYGVLAHELQEVIPQAVTGEKDAEQMQSVDYSKLVPILVQAIQEQNEILEQLKQEIEILKNK